MGAAGGLLRWEGNAVVAERSPSGMRTVSPRFVCLEAALSGLGYGFVCLVGFVCLFVFWFCDAFC